MNGLIAPGSDNYQLNPNEAKRLYCFWDTNSIANGVTAITEYFNAQGNSVDTKLPAPNRFPGGWDVTVWRMSLETVVTGQTPTTALDMNALVSGSWVRVMRNSTETIAEIPTSIIANTGGGTNDPGNAASNAQVPTFGLPSTTSVMTFPSFAQWQIPNGQFFHIDWIPDTGGITLSATVKLKIVLWTELTKPTS